MTHPLSRRAALTGGGAFWLIGAAPDPGAEVKITFLGQALIQHDLRAHPWPDFARFKAEFAKSDVVFTNLETVIDGPGLGEPTREKLTLHLAPAEVIDCLQALNVNLVASSNNHAFDLGAGGIRSTLAALDARRLPHAGLGLSLDEAAAPALVRTPRAAVALVAMATGAVRPGGAAAADRPGVNEVRREASGALNEDDLARYLSAISAAAKQAQVVLAYNHNHYWEADNSQTPAWHKVLARRCIDAGAACFVSHGAPLLHGIELYKGRPIFYDLGSFIFQTSTGEGRYPIESWETAVVACAFKAGRLSSATVTPVMVNEVGLGGPADMTTRGRPSYAHGRDAARILNRLSAISGKLGTRLQIRGESARLVIPAA